MRYTVKKGRHDFRPNLPNQFWPIPRGISEVIFLDLELSCWYDYTKVDGGKSWNKAGGIGGWLFENNKNAVLLAWRPDIVIGYFIASLYVNDKGGGWKVIKEVTFHVDETVALAYDRKDFRSPMEFRLFKAPKEGTSLPKEVDYTWENPPFTLRRRGPWFGGQYPAYNDMACWVSFGKLKMD